MIMSEDDNENDKQGQEHELANQLIHSNNSKKINTNQMNHLTSPDISNESQQHHHNQHNQNEPTPDNQRNQDPLKNQTSNSSGSLPGGQQLLAALLALDSQRRLLAQQQQDQMSALPIQETNNNIDNQNSFNYHQSQETALNLSVGGRQHSSSSASSTSSSSSSSTSGRLRSPRAPRRNRLATRSPQCEESSHSGGEQLSGAGLFGTTPPNQLDPNHHHRQLLAAAAAHLLPPGAAHLDALSLVAGLEPSNPLARLAAASLNLHAQQQQQLNPHEPHSANPFQAYSLTSYGLIESGSEWDDEEEHQDEDQHSNYNNNTNLSNNNNHNSDLNQNYQSSDIDMTIINHNKNNNYNQYHHHLKNNKNHKFINQYHINQHNRIPPLDTTTNQLQDSTTRYDQESLSRQETTTMTTNRSDIITPSETQHNRPTSTTNNSTTTHRNEADDLDRIRNFIEQFKARRGALNLTQKQAAQCFRAYTKDRYAFSDNFVGHFEGFQFRPQTAMTIADSLADWLEFAENETRNKKELQFMQGKVKETRKRKYEVIRIRDSAKRILVEAFERNKSPSATELEQLSRKTNIPSRNIEIFFKNRRTSRQYHM